MAWINTTPETARRSWFPQGLAKNNKILNIPLPCVIVVAFSAELASLQRKTTESNTFCVKQQPVSIRFPSTFKNYHLNLSMHECSVLTRITDPDSCEMRSSPLTVCFYRNDYLFHLKRDSPGGNKTVSVHKSNDSIATCSSDTSRP